jgi:hypothetical protein
MAGGERRESFLCQEGKQLLLQKLDRVNFSATFICI